MTTIINGFWNLRKSRSFRRETASPSKEATSATDETIPPVPPLPPLPPLPLDNDPFYRLQKRLSLPPGPAVGAVGATNLSGPGVQTHQSRRYSAISSSTRNGSFATTATNGATYLDDADVTEGPKSGGDGASATGVDGVWSKPLPTIIHPSDSPRSSVDPISASKSVEKPLPALPPISYSTIPSFSSQPSRRKAPPPPLSPKPHSRVSSHQSPPGSASPTSQYSSVPKSSGSDLGSPTSSRLTTTPITATPTTPGTRRSDSLKVTRRSLRSSSPSGSTTAATSPFSSHSASSSLTSFHKVRHHQQKQWEPPVPSLKKIQKHYGPSTDAADQSFFTPRSKSFSRKVKKARGAAMAFHTNGSLSQTAQIGSGGGGSISQNNPQAVYQHIVDTTAKRISTLDYLRKSHESRVYWFNTLQFSRPDLLKLPSYSPPKLARRAHNYLLLGFSLPLIIDLNSQTPTEYLKAVNALFTEFEQYQNMHPPDGSSGSSSLSRARIPSMFKRAASSNKTRRLTDASMGDGSSMMPPPPSTASSGSAIGAGNSSTSLHTTAGSSAPSGMNGLPSNGNSSSTLVNAAQLSSAPTTPHSAHPPSTASAAEPLLPSESYTHLLTPPLPFDPDFFETFATLCDVLIDCYSRVTQLIVSPDSLSSGQGALLAELFAKADGKVKKVIFGGMMREFEDRAREGLRGEVAGVGKVVLGGLMP